MSRFRRKTCWRVIRRKLVAGEPPSYAERPALNHTPQTSPSATVCKEQKQTSTPACCAKKKKESPAHGVRWTLGMAAQRCQGSTAFWVNGALGLPPSPPTVWSPAVVAVD